MKQQLIDNLKKYGQEHLLKFYDSLNDAEKADLTSELEKIDFANLDKLIKTYVMSKPEMSIPDDLTPAPYFPMNPETAEQQKLYAEAEAEGKKLIAAGKVGCLIVAGGQGTRLGFDGPKGTYPIGPVSNNSLFSFFANSIARLQEKYNVKLYWYVMTSLLNREATEKFFAENNNFGLEKDQIFFFSQGTMPAIDYNGKILMNSKSTMALSPDGHGGTLLALRKSGALDHMKANGIDYLSYFQVDNPLVPVINPLFVGLHALEKSEMSAVMLAKTNAFEKLGNFCISKGRLEIIEYSDLPEKLATMTDEKGKLKFIAGSPAIHVISRNFIEQLTASGNLNLPCHRADKKVPFIDENGNLITPDKPNAVKLETFIFDALPLASATMVLECDRANVFAPTKNPTGVDSVESCRMMIMERDAKRLEAAGVKVPRNPDGTLNAKIEISPRAAFDEEDVKNYVKAKNITAIAAESENYLD
ncbi:MAG: UDPGP type 1 family protein [Lentisphaeria bacterium]|nr:UDPGP type 1 family protein [Lentisphaeria bacterium]